MHNSGKQGGAYLNARKRNHRFCPLARLIALLERILTTKENKTGKKKNKFSRSDKLSV
jgi:hypothetical protein